MYLTTIKGILDSNSGEYFWFLGRAVEAGYKTPDSCFMIALTILGEILNSSRRAFFRYLIRIFGRSLESMMITSACSRRKVEMFISDAFVDVMWREIFLISINEEGLFCSCHLPHRPSAFSTANFTNIPYEQYRHIYQTWSHVPWNIVGRVSVLILSVHSESRLDAHVLTRRSYPKDYKNKGGLKQDDLRRRREEQQVEIRRQKRDENISKRRNFLPSSGVDSDDEAGGSGGLDAPVSLNLLFAGLKLMLRLDCPRDGSGRFL